MVLELVSAALIISPITFPSAPVMKVQAIGAGLVAWEAEVGAGPLPGNRLFPLAQPFPAASPAARNALPEASALSLRGIASALLHFSGKIMNLVNKL